MSVTVTKTDGVTVLTLTSDSKSSLPPICQILKSLCYSPVWCSVSQRLRRVQGSSLTALGMLQIMVGLVNIALAVIVNNTGDFWYDWHKLTFPFIFGGLCIFFGAMNILSQKCPSPCLVALNTILNVGGASLAIAAIVIYSINIANKQMSMWYCENYRWGPTPSPSSDPDRTKKNCLEVLKLTEMLLRSMNALLIILSVLELCVTFSSAVLGFKALSCSEKRENESSDPECYQPLLDEDLIYPTV